ncbi:NTF2-like protein [Aspergillus floccosus]
MSFTREHLQSLPASFFTAVDDRDLERVASHFAPDATLTVHTGPATFTGAAQIKEMFAGFIASSKTMSHEVVSVVVDEVRGTVATQQRYVGVLADGTQNDMFNCNFFEVGEDGRFKKVDIWMAGVSPLK